MKHLFVFFTNEFVASKYMTYINFDDYTYLEYVSFLTHLQVYYRTYITNPHNKN